ncbi:amino acid transporter-like protein [Ramaria rubella]|nr:amino acid transporter-like protein [Ramaria rubella]
MGSQPTTLTLEEKDYGVDEGAMGQALHAGKVPFEALLYFAAIQRQREEEWHAISPATPKASTLKGKLKAKFKSGPAEATVVEASDDEKTGLPSSITRDEKLQAQRAVRTATWLSIFYLVTTDILGPSSAPWAFSQLGFVSGALLFFFLGLAAFYTGMQLWHMYLKLDSDEYPVQTYSDLTERIFGRTCRHGINMLQTVQLVFNVAVIIISNTQGLSQVSKGRVCFSVLAVIWTIAGMLIGQIRSLQNYGGLAHWAIWIHLIVVFITMGSVVHFAPNFAAALRQNSAQAGPLVTSALIQSGFKQQVVGVMQMVYAYGGAMLFVELMAEMKRPFDFWKGMVFAQLIIVTVYMMYGVFVYAFQGQFTINPANQGISKFGLQTATNVLSLLSSLIAAGLYGNIGLKVIYVNIVQGIFNGPAIISRAGRIIWTCMVLGYWAFAFIIASAIPQISNIEGVVSAFCILQFTYTFPPILYVGFTMQHDAIDGQPQYTPGADVSSLRLDTWWSWSRWRRGFVKRWWLNTFNFVLFLAALATAGLGAFSSIDQIKGTFSRGGSATSFGCKPPV